MQTHSSREASRINIKTYKHLIIIVMALIAATLAFIWGNSLESVTVSGNFSKSVLKAVRPFFEIIVGKGNVTEHFVRKTAHFVEFGTLGCEAALFIILRRHTRARQIVIILLAGLAAAGIDEALQLLSGRGSQVSDVLLDFCGAVTGTVCVLLIYGVVRRFKREKQRLC